MKRSLALVVGLSLLTGLVVSAEGPRIRIYSARVVDGFVVVSGGRAGPNAPISWEGEVVTTSDRRGRFSFSAFLPSDCRGRLSDGERFMTVVVKGPARGVDCRPPAPVPQTGQTFSYVDGDDGGVQQGIALPSPRFADNSDGTITDNLTGLIWLKNADCPQDRRSFSDAIDDVSSLNQTGSMNFHDCGDMSNTLSHQTDWRLPNLKELHSLINYGFANPAISDAAGTQKGSAQDPFSDLIITGYWSSTTFAEDPSRASGVDFGIGGVNYGPKADQTGRVLAVRGGFVE